MAETTVDYVRNAFKSAKSELSQNLVAQGEDILSQTRQANAMRGTTGPLATALEQKAKKGLQSKYAEQATNLAEKEATAISNARKQDDIAKAQADAQFWSNIWTGVGALVPVVGGAVKGLGEAITNWNLDNQIEDIGTVIDTDMDVLGLDTNTPMKMYEKPIGPQKLSI